MGEGLVAGAPREQETHTPCRCASAQPKPTKGRMRIHCLENVDKALQFLKEQKVHLENMGSHDIVDGNHRLTLGLVWTIILRFQVPGNLVDPVPTQVAAGQPPCYLFPPNCPPTPAIAPDRPFLPRGCPGSSQP